MPRWTAKLPTLLLAGAATLLLAGPSALANRCGDQNPPRCGFDAPFQPGGTGGCTDASLATLPLYKGTGMCQPGYSEVIYDLATPFPDNGMPGDASVAGTTSFLTVRAGTSSACAHMIDDVDPKPCPDPQLCPGSSTQPQGARKVGVTGYIVGCWSPPDREGCRTLAVYTKSMCLHAQHEFLGPGCGMEDGIDCSQVSVEQIGIDVPGAKNRRLCPPLDPTTSCRGTHGQQPGLHFWIGGVCATNNCANPGTAPDVDPVDTCKVSWGATRLGYDSPDGKGINAPGWYDWKTGSFKVDLSSPKPTCGPLGRCLGERTGQTWDLRLVAVPRPGQSAPCLGIASCNAPGCLPPPPTTTTTTSTTATTTTT